MATQKKKFSKRGIRLSRKTLQSWHAKGLQAGDLPVIAFIVGSKTGGWPHALQAADLGMTCKQLQAARDRLELPWAADASKAARAIKKNFDVETCYFRLPVAVLHTAGQRGLTPERLLVLAVIASMDLDQKEALNTPGARPVINAGLLATVIHGTDAGTPAHEKAKNRVQFIINKLESPKDPAARYLKTMPWYPDDEKKRRGCHYEVVWRPDAQSETVADELKRDLKNEERLGPRNFSNIAAARFKAAVAPHYARGLNGVEYKTQGLFTNSEPWRAAWQGYQEACKKIGDALEVYVSTPEFKKAVATLGREADRGELRGSNDYIRTRVYNELCFGFDFSKEDHSATVDAMAKMRAQAADLDPAANPCEA